MEDAQVQASGHDSGPGPSSLNSSSTTRRACDACRARKVRCDREFPCSHCRHAKIECTHTDSRPKQKRARILLTTQYERKIDLIDRRLDSVVELLEDLKTNYSPNPDSNKHLERKQRSGGDINNSDATDAAYTNDSPGAPNDVTAKTLAASTPSTYTVYSTTDSAASAAAGPVVEGESSLAAHSAFANEFLKRAVGADSRRDSRLEMRETLDALSHIVSALKQQTVASEMTFPHARPVPQRRVQGYELPPIQKTTALVREFKSRRFAATIWFFAYLPAHRFPDLCLSVYFSDDFSDADFITVNTGLYSLFWDYAYSLASPDDKDAYVAYADICRANLETALASLPLSLPATLDTIVALILGTFHAIELSKPLLAWTLCSKASELCQTLGYHRQSTYLAHNDKPEDTYYKQFLFWSVYYADKCLSLRRGRASTIPDWDITVPEPDPHQILKYHSGALPADFFRMWVESARIQGHIYELLYSPESVAQPDDVRQQRVDGLVARLEKLKARTQQINSQVYEHAKQQLGEALMDFYVESDHVLNLSLLTLVYRAAPRPAGSPTTFSAECISTARQTLQKHQDCIVVLAKSDLIHFPTYVHWTLLFAPFTPFIVIFCQVIETRGRADLAHLHAFITSMQSAPAVSDAAAKMHRLFQVLYSVALRYVECDDASSSAAGPGVSSGDASAAAAVSAEMDAYLAALGFPHATSTGTGGQQGPAQSQEGFGGGASNGAGAGAGAGCDAVFTGAGTGGVGEVGERGEPGGGGGGGDAMEGVSDGQRITNPMMWMGQGAQLEDWFYSNTAMMELVQQPEFNFPDNQG